MTRIPRGFDMPATPDRRHTTSFSSSSSELRRKALPKPLFSCTLPPFIPHRQCPTSQTNLPEPPSTFDAFDRHHSRLYSRRLLEGACEMYVAGRTTIHTHTHTHRSSLLEYLERRPWSVRRRYFLLKDAEDL